MGSFRPTGRKTLLQSETFHARNYPKPHFASDLRVLRLTVTILSFFLQYSNRQTQNSQIARICRYEAHRRQNTPGKAKLCLFRDFSGYFEPFGNFSYISYISHTNTMCGPPVVPQRDNRRCNVSHSSGLLLLWQYFDGRHVNIGKGNCHFVPIAVLFYLSPRRNSAKIG